jgi:hypothetical protein
VPSIKKLTNMDKVAKLSRFDPYNLHQLMEVETSFLNLHGVSNIQSSGHCVDPIPLAPLKRGNWKVLIKVLLEKEGPEKLNQSPPF